MTEQQLPRDSVYEEAARWLVRQDRAVDDHEVGLPGTRAGFQEWLAADPSHREAYEELQRLWLDTDEMSVQLRRDPSMADHLLDAPHQRLRRRRWWAAAAASLLLAAGLAFALLRLPGPPANIVATGTAEQREVALADGTSVHLNAESSLRVSIDERQREIELSRGEAVFTVAPDPDRPFVVRTAAGTVEAIGTEFTVRARDEELKVIVLEGRVRVTPQVARRTGQAPTPAIEVAQAGIARLHAGQATSRVAPQSEIERSLAWRKGLLEFDDVPLAEVIRDLDPYVPGRLVVPSKELSAMRVGGLLHVGEGHDPIESLTTALPLEAIRLGNLLTVVRRSDHSG